MSLPSSAWALCKLDQYISFPSEGDISSSMLQDALCQFRATNADLTNDVDNTCLEITTSDSSVATAWCQANGFECCNHGTNGCQWPSTMTVTLPLSSCAGEESCVFAGADSRQSIGVDCCVGDSPAGAALAASSRDTLVTGKKPAPMRRKHLERVLSRR